MLITLGVLFAIILIIVFALIQAQKAKFAELLDKYEDEAVVQRIMNGEFWENQTAEQLRDALGKPEAIDRKTMKTKSREVWKYQHRGANRYGLRITLENGLVSGWDQKT